MTQCEWEERVALYAGGDCDDTAAVEAHVAGCAACAGLLAAMEEDRGLLQQPPAIPAEAIEHLHARVLGGRRSYRRWWAAAAAAVVVAGVTGSFWWARTPTPPAELPVVARHVASPAIVVPEPPAAQTVRVVKRKHNQPAIDPAVIAAVQKALAPEPPPQPNGFLVKTKDPNVVFLLVPETKNGDTDD